MSCQQDSEYTKRLPAAYQQVMDAIDTAGWDRAVSLAGPLRVGDVHREVVEVAASTRTGHRVRVVFVADAAPGQPRPPFVPLAAIVGQGAAVRDASMGGAVEYVRLHSTGHPPS